MEFQFQDVFLTIKWETHFKDRFDIVKIIQNKYFETFKMYLYLQSKYTIITTIFIWN